MNFYLLAEEPLPLNTTVTQLNFMLHWETENYGLYFKKEVNQKEETEGKRAL